MRKLLIATYFGPTLPWYGRWIQSYQDSLQPAGYDLLIEHDLAKFNMRAEIVLSVKSPITAGGTKVSDYRACLGAMYETELQGYDFWGHTDLDCVYGRVERFWPDDLLAEHDVLTDNRLSYISGPWTLYRNDIEVNHAFSAVDVSRDALENPETTGWVEKEFTDFMRNQFDFHVEEHHAWDDPELLEWDGDRLMHDSREVSFFHFRYTKQWPL